MWVRSFHSVQGTSLWVSNVENKLYSFKNPLKFPIWLFFISFHFPHFPPSVARTSPRIWSPDALLLVLWRRGTLSLGCKWSRLRWWLRWLWSVSQMPAWETRNKGSWFAKRKEKTRSQESSETGSTSWIFSGTNGLSDSFKLRILSASSLDMLFLAWVAAGLLPIPFDCLNSSNVLFPPVFPAFFQRLSPFPWFQLHSFLTFDDVSVGVEGWLDRNCEEIVKVLFDHFEKNAWVIIYLRVSKQTNQRTVIPIGLIFFLRAVQLERSGSGAKGIRGGTWGGSSAEGSHGRLQTGREARISSHRRGSPFLNPDIHERLICRVLLVPHECWLPFSLFRWLSVTSCSLNIS